MEKAYDPGAETPKKQKYLGNIGLLILISFLSAFIPLSTDLYLPALPRMAENLNATVGLVNLTLTLFFAFYAIGTLFWGPLSDKYGRKKILLIGLIIYTAASVLCALCADVYQLIACRILQAIGSGAVTAVGTAIVKDVYKGRKLETTLSIVQSMMMIAPIVAPVLGGIILSFTSWRGVFWALSALSLLALAGGMAMEETIEQRSTGSLFAAVGRLAVVLKNSTFLAFVITFSVISIPFLAYISVSSYIYQISFGLSEQVYSYYFAFNALFMVFGPLLYIHLSKTVSKKTIITVSYGILALGGILLCAIGSLRPWVFALCLLPATFTGGFMRPPTVKLMLDEQQSDIGSASSLMNFAFTILGCVGMIAVSFNWANRILVIGLLYLIVAIIGQALWLFVCRRKVKREPD